MGDSSADSEPPSGAVLAVALGRGEAAGLLAAADAYGPDLLGYAEFLLTARPAAEDTHARLADEAAAAVFDALLAAAGAAGELADPDRMRPWLLALTRNECLRRRPGAGGPSSVEAAELGRRGLRPLEVAALLGFAPAALPRPVPAAETLPAWFRAELTAAAGPDGAARRAELTRRARPFEADGFPVPLDRRRLPGKVLAWSAAAVVLIALALLVGLPTQGNAGPSAVDPAALAEPSDQAAVPAEVPAEVPAGATPEPLPTLGAAFGSVPTGTVAAEADAGTTPAASAPATAAAPPARPDEQTDAADRGSRTAGELALTWTVAGCGDEWTAHLHVTTGGVEVTEVVAVASRAGTVELHRDGDGWSGDLGGLPTGRTVTVLAFADGQVRPTSDRLRADC